MKFFILFFQSEVFSINWAQLLSNASVFSLVLAIIWILYKVFPGWKEIQIKRLEVRDKEAESLGSLGAALSQLSNSIAQNSLITKEIVIEQRKMTENTQLLLRVSNNQTDNLAGSIDNLGARLDKIEEKIDCK